MSATNKNNTKVITFNMVVLEMKEKEKRVAKRETSIFKKSLVVVDWIEITWNWPCKIYLVICNSCKSKCWNELYYYLQYLREEDGYDDNNSNNNKKG